MRASILLKSKPDSRAKARPQNGIWIAASALEQGLPLATRDAHFARIKNLVVLQW